MEQNENIHIRCGVEPASRKKSPRSRGRQCACNAVFSKRRFPVKLQKIPCSEGIPAGPSDFAAICCISGAESSKIKDLVLIFFVSARGRAPGIQGGSR